MKKFLALALCLVLSLSVFAGCGADNQTTDNTAESDNVLSMATNAEFPPYEFHEGGEIVGIDAEVAKLIADKLGMDFKIEDMEFDSIIPAVTSGKVSMGMAGMTVTDERKQSVDFSRSYATGIQVVIVKDGSSIATIDDLTGKKIGVQDATTGDIYATDDFGDENVERYPKGADAILSLSQGKIDAVIIDNEPAKVFVAENEGLKILDTEYAVEDYAIAVKKGNTELLEKVDAALAELIADGSVQSIIDKYISAE